MIRIRSLAAVAAVIAGLGCAVTGSIGRPAHSGW